MGLALQLCLLTAAGILTWLGRRGVAQGIDTAVGRRTLLGVLVLVGAALRLTGVDGFLINPDEAMFLQTANREHLNDVFGTSLFHAHPPASYYIYHAVGLATRDIFWLRMPPFLAGVAMIGLAWWLGREVAGARGGLALAWLVTFSPGLIELSSVCRNYTFAFAFLLAALAGMARFVAGGRWRDYALFVGGFMLAYSFLYSLTVAAAAMGIVVGLHGLIARKPLRWWGIVAAGQVPSALLVLFYQRVHIGPFSRLRAGSYSTSWMEAQFSASPAQILRNTAELFATTFTEPLSVVYLFAALVGIAVLTRGRRWLFLSAALLPFALALALVAIQKLPYGGTRHTLYLFPFCMGLVLPALGFMADRGKLFGWAVAGLMAAHGVIASVETVRLAGRQELPAREDEFNRAIATLESRFQPGDFVLLDEQSALVASFHLPELSAWYWETVPRQYERNGVLYCYIPHTNWYFKPQHLVAAAERAIAEFGHPRTGTLWVLHAGWEEQGDLRQRIEKRLPVIQFPETGFVPSARRGSRPLLLAIRAQEIATIREAFPEWEHRHQ